MKSDIKYTAFPRVGEKRHFRNFRSCARFAARNEVWRFERRRVRADGGFTVMVVYDPSNLTQHRR